MFEKYGYTNTTEMYVTDCISSAYWYKDPICYKTELDNSNLLKFDKEFARLFGEEMKHNQAFLKKIKRLNNFYR